MQVIFDKLIFHIQKMKFSLLIVSAVGILIGASNAADWRSYAPLSTGFSRDRTITSKPVQTPIINKQTQKTPTPVVIIHQVQNKQASKQAEITLALAVQQKPQSPKNVEYIQEQHQSTSKPVSGKCAPFESEVAGICTCDQTNCNSWKGSHLCQWETERGQCACNDNLCSRQDMVCDQRTLQGECVECTVQTQQESCLDNQVCYKNKCVCIDQKCEDGLVCQRQYSKNAQCVTCRNDQQCSEQQKCNDQGQCVCSPSKCQAKELICPSIGSNLPEKCIQCQQNQNCSPFQICQANICICEDSRCPSGFCTQNTAQGVCVQCQQDQDCDESFQICKQNQCVCQQEKCEAIDVMIGCSSEDSNGRCIECSSNENCTAVDQICFLGICKCIDQNCPVDTPFCFDAEVGPCSECRKNEHCGPEQICGTDGSCVSSCRMIGSKQIQLEVLVTWNQPVTDFDMQLLIEQPGDTVVGFGAQGFTGTLQRNFGAVSDLDDNNDDDQDYAIYLLQFEDVVQGDYQIRLFPDDCFTATLAPRTASSNKCLNGIIMASIFVRAGDQQYYQEILFTSSPNPPSIPIATVTITADDTSCPQPFYNFVITPQN